MIPKLKISLTKRVSQLIHDNLALQKENLRLQREIARIKAQKISATHQAIAGFETLPIEELTTDDLAVILRHRKDRTQNAA